MTQAKLEVHKKIRVWADHDAKHLSDLALPKLDGILGGTFYRSSFGIAGHSAASAQEKQVDKYLEDFILASKPVFDAISGHEAMNIILTRRNQDRRRNRLQAAKAVARVIPMFLMAKRLMFIEGCKKIKMDTYNCNHWWLSPGEFVLGYEENRKNTFTLGGGDGYHRAFDDKNYPATEEGLLKLIKHMLVEEKTQ